MSADVSPLQTYLLSPDIDIQESNLSKEGGFYLLRKDSERRQTLVHILEQDSLKVGNSPSLVVHFFIFFLHFAVWVIVL